MATIDWDAFIDAAAAAQGLTIDPAYRPGVAVNLQRIAAVAQRFLAVPLDDAVEPAPVFAP